MLYIPVQRMWHDEDREACENMKTIPKKMMRHWPRFLLLFLILMFIMLLCYLVGQVYVQAVISAREIEENAVTLAVPTSPYEVS